MSTFDPYMWCYFAKLECGHTRRVTNLQGAGTLVSCSQCPEIERPQGKVGKLPLRRVTKIWHQTEKEPKDVQEDALLKEIRECYFEPGRDYTFEVSKSWESGFYIKKYSYFCHVKQDFPSWMSVAYESFSTRLGAEKWGRDYLKRRGPSKDYWMIQQALEEGRLELDGTLYKYEEPTP